MDIIDRAQDEEMAHREAMFAARPPFKLEPGEQGDCETCGEWSGRLVGGSCAPCRDKYKLP